MIISDLHIHSRFSQACSRQITLESLERYARIKGIGLLGTADFQHPRWNLEIKKELEEDDKGILWSKNKFPFIWQTELSLIYSQEGKGRRIHYVVLVPGKEIADQVIEALAKKGRLDYDGRPIFGFTSIELVDMMVGISRDIEIIPAHAWTPWYAIFGSKSGFDSVEECFKERSKYIHAIESGMSSDPPMNWRLSNLDKYNIVSFSDSHSFWPWRLGREATVFDCELSYKNILNAIRTGNGLKMTIETVPDYGRYHFDGHRGCNVCLSPAESKKLEGKCPSCGRDLTIGVLNRVEELADRDEGYKRQNFKDYKRLIPLHEIISAVYGIKMLASKRVWDIYNNLIGSFGSEFNVLLHVSFDELKKIDDKLAPIIIKNREDKLKIRPGYDGEYGKLILNSKEEQKNLSGF